MNKLIFHIIILFLCFNTNVSVAGLGWIRSLLSCEKVLNSKIDSENDSPKPDLTKKTEKPLRLENFHSKATIVVPSDISFSEDDLNSAIKFLIEKHFNTDLRFEILNPNLANLSNEVLGDLRNYEHTPFKRRKYDRPLQRSFILHQTPTNPSPFLALSVDDQPSHQLVINEFPPRVLQGLSWFFQKLCKEILRANPNYKLYHGDLILRATSNTVGHSVNKTSLQNETGFHRHSNFVPNVFEFTWNLRGAGTLYIKNREIKQIAEGEVLLFGDHVDHGSPDSEELRLLVVGHVRMEKKSSTKHPL